MLCASNSKDASSTDQTQCNSGPDAPNLKTDTKGSSQGIHKQVERSLIEMWWKQVETTTWPHVLSSARAGRTCEIQKLMKTPKEWLSDPIVVYKSYDKSSCWCWTLNPWQGAYIKHQTVRLYQIGLLQTVRQQYLLHSGMYDIARGHFLSEPLDDSWSSRLIEWSKHFPKNSNLRQSHSLSANLKNILFRLPGGQRKGRQVLMDLGSTRTTWWSIRGVSKERLKRESQTLDKFRNNDRTRTLATFQNQEPIVRSVEKNWWPCDKYAWKHSKALGPIGYYHLQTSSMFCSRSISSNKLLLRLCHLFRGHVLQTADDDGTCPMRLIPRLQDLAQNVTQRGLKIALGFSAHMTFLGIICLICSFHVGACIKDSERDDVSPCNLDTLVLWGFWHAQMPY